MKLTIILCSVIALLVILLILLLVRVIKLHNEKNKYKLLSENQAASISKIEENISNANKQKSKLNTGNDVTDLANGLNIMQELSKKR